MGNLDEDMKQCHRAGMKWAGIPCNDNGDEIEYDENGKEYIVQSVEDAECRMKGTGIGKSKSKDRGKTIGNGTEALI